MLQIFGFLDDVQDHNEDNDFNAFVLGDNGKEKEAEIQEAILSKNLLILERHSKLDVKVCRFNIKANPDRSQNQKYAKELWLSKRRHNAIMAFINKT